MKNPCLENLIISPGHCWGPGRCGRYYHLNGCKLQGRGKNLTFGLNHAGAWAHEIRCGGGGCGVQLWYVHFNLVFVTWRWGTSL